LKHAHSIAQLCSALAVTRSGYHAWQAAPDSQRRQADAALLGDIQQIHAGHRGRYGAPRIQRELGRRGARHGTKRIARLMRQAGLQGRRPRRFVPRTTRSDHDQPIAPNHLAGRATPTGPNQVWVSDLTYVPTGEGWLYVAVIFDLWSRRIIGWSTGSTLATSVVLAAAGNPYDNATMESFMATHKRECSGLAEESRWINNPGGGDRQLLLLRGKRLQPGVAPQRPRVTKSYGL
jgi:transposase InsO family protein